MEETYSFKKASKEVTAMQMKIESGEARNYYEAEKLVDAESFYQRFLQPNFIPSEEQVQKARENGIELETLFYNSSTGHAIKLGGQLADMVREELSREIRRARSKGEGARIVYKENEAVHAVLTKVFESIPQEWVEHYQNGVLEIRLATYCKNPKEYARSKEYFPGAEISSDPPIATAAELIDFSEIIDWEDVIEEDQTLVVTKKANTAEKIQVDRQEPNERNAGPDDADPVPPRIMNRVQKLRYVFGRAIRSGDPAMWDEASDEYLALKGTLPQYTEHRWALIDLKQRFESGEISKMPSKILSVASGPYEEANAQTDFEFYYRKNGIEKPDVINIDLSHTMLKKSEDDYERKAVEKNREDYWNIPQNIVADMRVLPIKDESIDLVECSSLDNLIKQDPEGVVKTLQEMLRVLEVGGLFRISHKEQLSDEFFDTLQALGLTLLTEPHTTYAVDEVLLRKIKHLYTPTVAKRLIQKVSSGAEYILAIKNGEATMTVPTITRGEALIVPRKEISLENANRLKESLNYFLEQEGRSKLFHENKRRRYNVPFKKFRRDILHAVVKSLIEEADNNLAVIHGVPYSMKDRLSEFMSREDESDKPLVALDEVALLDCPYREKLLRDYAPSIYQQLHKEGVVYEEGAP